MRKYATSNSLDIEEKISSKDLTKILNNFQPEININQVPKLKYFSVRSYCVN